MDFDLVEQLKVSLFENSIDVAIDFAEIGLDNLLSDISEQLYNYVYSYNPRYNDYQEYLMAKSPMARELIKNALLKQLSYTLRNGKINEFAGVNVSYNQTNAVNLMEDVRG